MTLNKKIVLLTDISRDTENMKVKDQTESEKNSDVKERKSMFVTLP